MTVFAANLTPDAVMEEVRNIRAMAGDAEGAHGAEDALRHEVLAAIATSTVTGVDAILCALHALTTSDIEFPRWCA